MQKILLLLSILLLQVACHQEVSNKSLAEMEQNMREINADNDSTKIKKAQKALIESYLEYAKKNTGAIETPDYLFKAAGLTEVVSKNTAETVKILEQIPQKYPDSERAAQALYRLATIYQDKMKDTVVAKQYFTELMEKYPNHPLAISLQQ
jgi:TolA-binding protein